MTEIVKHGADGALIVDRTWTPSPLALLGDEDFAFRVECARNEVARMKTIQKEIMVNDIDYGKVPGVPKPFLFQPGAQVLNRFTGYVPSYTTERIIGDGDDTPTLTYIVTCRLLDAEGTLVGEGLGTANTWEVKHRYRHGDRTCPQCGVNAIRKSQYDEKYYCAGAKDGCGAKFKDGTPGCADIDAQKSMTQNQDPHDLDNTIIKMGAKRAYVAATVVAHACSGLFSQEGGDDLGRGSTTTTAAKTPRAEDTTIVSSSEVSRCWGHVKKRFADLGYTYNTDSVAFCLGDIFAEMEASKFEELQVRQIDAVLGAIGEWVVDESGEES